MPRLFPGALALAALVALPSASAQTVPGDDASAEARVLTALGVPVRPAAPGPFADAPRAAPASLPDADVPAWVEAQTARRPAEARVAPPTAQLVPDTTPDAAVPSAVEAAIRARRVAEAEAPRVAPSADGASLAPSAGRIRARLGTVTVRDGATLRTSQNILVDAGAALAFAPTSTLTLTGGDDQTVDTPAALSLPRLTLAKTAGTATLLDAATVTAALDLSDDVLIAADNLTVSGTVTGTGGLGVSGSGAQLFTFSAPLALGQFQFLKSGGTATFTQPVTVSETLTSNGTGTLVGPVTVGPAGTLVLAGGTLTLGQDLAVYRTVVAGGGTFVRNGFTLRLAATTTGSTVDRLAAVSGDGSTVGDALAYDRPFLDGAGWRMIAAPFAAVPFTSLNDDFHTQGATGADVPNGTPNLYRWAPGNAPGSRYVGVTDFTAPFASGQGYFLYAYATAPGSGAPILPTTWDVDGTEPAASVTAGLSFDLADAEKRFNLLGNPYAAPIDWHAMQTAGQFQSAYAVWDPAAGGGTGAYAYYSSTGVATGRAGRYVPAFQGFWTESSGTSPFVLTYDRAWKAPAAAGVYAGLTADAVPQLRLHLAGEGLMATDPVVLFLDESADGADLLDATWLAPLSPDYAAAYFVRAEDGRPLVFEARPAATRQPLRLAVEATRPGRYTLSWPDLSAAPQVALTLVDLTTGQQTDMRQATSVSVDVNATRLPDEGEALPTALARTVAPRFELIVGDRTTSGEAPPAVASLTLDTARPNPASATARIRFALPEAGPAQVRLVDLLGRTVAVVAERGFEAGWHEVPIDVARLPAGVYVVRLGSAGAVRTTRLTVTH